MKATAEEVGIPVTRIYATGSNKAKVQKIKELSIGVHYDNNPDVIDDIKNMTDARAIKTNNN